MSGAVWDIQIAQGSCVARMFNIFHCIWLCKSNIYQCEAISSGGPIAAKLAEMCWLVRGGFLNIAREFVHRTRRKSIQNYSKL